MTTQNRIRIVLLLLVLSLVLVHVIIASAGKERQYTSSTNGNKNKVSLQDLTYRVYPRRSEDEAAVIEWGHSAIISAVDASVAHFGPQTSQAALLEVETMPILANPINGRWENDDKTKNESNKDEFDNENDDNLTNNNNDVLRKLDNADDVFGNAVVMTNTGGLSGIEMAVIAQKSGAAALIVVNVDEDRPDDIHRLGVNENSDEDSDIDELTLAESIDIPVVMISLNSANVLTTATVTDEQQKPEDIVNHGMPERIRLYAGGDRPFLEDVEASQPTMYIIHNLLTKKECNILIQQSKQLVSPIVENDSLQITQDYEKFVNVQRVMLWDGALKSTERKAIDERIEQVTGFPATHFSGFIIDKLSVGSYWQPHYDTIDGSIVPIATITVFLSDTNNGGEIIYPSTAGDPVKIQPRKGLAVVHYNSDENNQFEVNSIHGILPVSYGGDELYVARKFILPTPVSNTRRIVLPLLAYLTGGKLPSIIVTFYKLMIIQFGQEIGDVYFDKFFIYLPIVIGLVIAQFIINFVRKKLFPQSDVTISSPIPKLEVETTTVDAVPTATTSSSSSSSKNKKSNKKKD